MRVEFLYTRKDDMTQIYVWAGTQIIDKREMPGVLSSYSKKKIREEIAKEYKKK